MMRTAAERLFAGIAVLGLAFKTVVHQLRQKVLLPGPAAGNESQDGTIAKLAR